MDFIEFPEPIAHQLKNTNHKNEVLDLLNKKLDIGDLVVYPNGKTSLKIGRVIDFSPKGARVYIKEGRAIKQKDIDSKSYTTHQQGNNVCIIEKSDGYEKDDKY